MYIDVTHKVVSREGSLYCLSKHILVHVKVQLK